MNVFEYTLATTVSKFVINNLVKLTMLRTTGPRVINVPLHIERHTSSYPQYLDMLTPRQFYILLHLLWVYTICSDLPVQILRVNMVDPNQIGYAGCSASNIFAYQGSGLAYRA